MEEEKFIGVQAIYEERLRQIVKLGYDKEHDDAHADEALAFAAASYAIPQGVVVGGLSTDELKGRLNPWDIHGNNTMFVKEKNFTKEEIEKRQRELAKAGALCAAEYDRLERLKSN